MTQVNRLDYSREKQILVNLILNNEYCRRVLPVLEPEYFRSRSAVRIISWVSDYYGSFKSAPRGHIRDIFENESQGLDPDEKDQIETVLSHIEEVISTDNQNIDYLVDVAYKFCKNRLIEIQVAAASKHITEGKFDLAEEALAKRFEANILMNKAVAWNDRGLIKDTISYMIHKDDPDTAFFRFPGRLGQFIGNLERAWFVAFIAPSKRGKTIYMAETIIAAIQQGLNVVFFSLEMPTKQVFARVLKCVVGNRPSDEEYEVMSPVFDCEHNQKGKCDKSQRQGFGEIYMDDRRLTYEEASGWQVCTECRGTIDFEPAAWKIPVKKKPLNESEYFAKSNAFMRLYGKRCRTFFYPSKTAGVADFVNDLDALEHNENFIADVVVIDYADLIKPAKGGEKRHVLDDIWEDLRAVEQSRNLLLVTASQTNRGGKDSKYLKDTDIAEDYSKIAKLDLGIGLCQTDEMKEEGMMNFNKVVYRHGEFVQSHVCSALQELSNMQSILDSEFKLM